MSQTEIYTPGLLLGVYTGEMRTALDGRIIRTRGRYQFRYSNREYAGYYYDQLVSPHDGKVLRVRIHNRVRVTLKDNRIYTFSGHVERRPGLSSVDLLYVIDSVDSEEEQVLSADDMKRFELLQKRSSRASRNFEELVKNAVYRQTRVRLANIYGLSAIVDRDFDTALAGAAAHFEVKSVRCSLASAQALIKAITELAAGGYDVVGILRGGGDSEQMAVFNDAMLAEALLGCELITVTALGHSVDDSLADRMADRKFDLPFDYGATLNRWTDEAFETMSRSRAFFMGQVREEVERHHADHLRSLQLQLDLRQNEAAEARRQLEQTLLSLSAERSAMLEEDGRRRAAANQERMLLAEQFAAREAASAERLAMLQRETGLVLRMATMRSKRYRLLCLVLLGMLLMALAAIAAYSMNIFRA